MMILRLLLAVTGSGMAIVLAVVMLIYAIYLPGKPELARQLPLLTVTTAVFTLWGLFAGLAGLARIRGWPRAWMWDGLLLLLFPLSLMFLWRAYS